MRIFETLGAKNTGNTDVVCASEATNRVITMCFAIGSKNQQCFFLPAPSKNTVNYLRSFDHVAKCIFLSKKDKNTVFYDREEPRRINISGLALSGVHPGETLQRIVKHCLSELTRN